jgi:hypothetical protein
LLVAFDARRSEAVSQHAVKVRRRELVKNHLTVCVPPSTHLGSIEALREHLLHVKLAPPLQVSVLEVAKTGLAGTSL